LSGNLLNLTRARKTRARADQRRQADAYAAKFGRTKAERDAAALEAEKATRQLDQHKLEGDDQ
jgi:hypothetical protein